MAPLQPSHKAGLPSFIDRLLGPFARFTAAETSGGLVLMGCAILALLWANSPWAASYDHVWHTSVTLGKAPVSIHMSLQHWINDGLMTIFFFLVGLEIKRELLAGELASVRNAVLPIAAALGGMIVPALFYVAVNTGQPGAPGWGIPMATDIAFSLGVLALLGSRIPIGLKVFLTALAIVDDLGAVLVIALFYTSDIAFGALGLGFGAIAIAMIGNLLGLRTPVFYGIVGIVAWFGMLHSGVHATIAGVLMALTIPMPFTRIEHSLHTIVAFLIMPLFALANAGVTIGGVAPVAGATSVTLGVILGLLFGKPLGITLFSWIAVRLGMAALPQHTSWRAIHGVSWLAGIGFTMSLLVAGLAFGESELLDSAKIGILGASCLAGFIGWVILRNTTGSAEFGNLTGRNDY